MKLTSENLEIIRAFIARRGFKYLDVQMEILDHVATSVEKKMEADPSLEFHSALERSHANFGIMGFSTIADAISTGLEKKYRHMFWNNFKSYFGYKYILLIVILSVTVFNLVGAIPIGQIEYYVLLPLGIGHILIMLINVKNRYNNSYSQYLSYNISRMYSDNWYLFYLLTLITVIVTPASSAVFGISTVSLLITAILTLSVPAMIASYLVSKSGVDEARLLAEKRH